VQCVDAHQGHVRVLLGVAHQVKVNHLLHYQVPGLDAKHHIVEKARDINPKSHVGNNFLDHFAFLLGILVNVDHFEQLEKKKKNRQRGSDETTL
jgi:hypothetical protein